MKKSRFSRQIVTTIISRGVQLGIGFLTGIVVARYLGAHGRGYLALLLAVPTILISLGEFGIRQSAAFLLGKGIYQEKDIHQNLNVLLVGSSAASLLIILASYRQMDLYAHGFIPALCIALVAPLTLAQKYAAGVMLARKEVERINVIQVANASSILLILLFLAFLSNLTLVSATLAYTFGNAIAVGATAYFLRDYYSIGLSTDKEIIKTLLRTGLLFALGLLVLVLNYRADVLILGYMKSTESVGIYSVGVGLCEIARTLPAAVGMVLFSRSVNWGKEYLQEALSNVLFLTRMVFLSSIAFSAFLVAISGALVPFLYGKEFAASAHVVLLLSPGVVALSVLTILHIFVAGQGRPEISIYATLPGLLMNVLLNLYLIPKYDYLGAAVSSSVSYTFMTIAYVFVFSRMYNIPAKDFLIQSSDISRVFAFGAGRQGGRATHGVPVLKDHG